MDWGMGVLGFPVLVLAAARRGRRAGERLLGSSPWELEPPPRPRGRCHFGLEREEDSAHQPAHGTNTLFFFLGGEKKVNLIKILSFCKIYLKT